MIDKNKILSGFKTAIDVLEKKSRNYCLFIYSLHVLLDKLIKTKTITTYNITFSYNMEVIISIDISGLIFTETYTYKKNHTNE